MIVDLYAGAGGWSCAARRLGLEVVGLELDPAACDTRRAARLPTIRTDLQHYQLPPATQLDGLIASPPCQIFSAAGNRLGARLLPVLVAELRTHGWAWPGHRFPPDARLLWLVADWWDRHRPRWVACEQVPSVLPFWEALADRMRTAGWSAWTGVVDAANYGVPQNRRRAILLAHADRPAGRPEPTHAKVPPLTLFGPELEPWVSMADALGWPDAWVLDQREGSPNRTRELDRPAPTVTARPSTHWVLDRREGPRDGRNPPRTLDRPAPTVTTSAVDRNWAWSRPATTVTTNARIWPPGHKLNQSDIDRLGREQAEAPYAGRAGTDAIRVTPIEAAALQTFPACWPWRGTKSEQARQIGNAVPPLLAEAILTSVLG